MIDDQSKDVAEQMAAAPQGTRDSDMPMPPPNPGGEVGPSPSADTIPAGDPTQTGPGVVWDRDPNEREDPGVADAGGVDAPDTDGSTRT